MSNLIVALSYAQAGLAVLPLWWLNAQGRCACGREPGDNCKPAKHPIPTTGVKAASADEETIRTWWSRYPQAGIGIAGGDVSGGLLWLDFDKRAEETFPKWRASIGALYDTLAVVKTGQGYRVAFRVEGIEAKNDPNIARGPATPDGKKGELLIEAKGGGGYGIAPPSIHPSGVPYLLIHGDLTDLPTLASENAITLLTAARALSEYTEPQPERKPVRTGYRTFSQEREENRLTVWRDVWDNIDIYTLEAIVPELDPRPSAGYLGRMLCPQCGKHEAYLYPPNGTQGVAIRCNRLNKCAYEKTLFAYLNERDGGTDKAVRVLHEATNVPLPSQRMGMGKRTQKRVNGFTLTREDLAHMATTTATIPEARTETVAVKQSSEDRFCAVIEPDGSASFHVPEKDRHRQRVTCSICRWQDIPGGWMHVQGQDYPVCLACHAAGPKRGEVALCALCAEQDRETTLTAIRRIEPGGCLACGECLEKWVAARTRR